MCNVVQKTFIISKYIHCSIQMNIYVIEMLACFMEIFFCIANI
jgi:hypothetical protein